MSEAWLIWLVTQRELIDRLRMKSFRFFTIAIMLLAGAGIVLADRGPEWFGGGTTNLGVVQPAAGVADALSTSADLLNFKLDITEYASQPDAQAALTNGNVRAFLDGDRLVYNKSSDDTLTAVVNRALYQVQLPALLDQLGLTPQQAAQLLNPALANVQLLNPEPAAPDKGDRQALAAISTIGLYMMLALYGNWILTGVVEEKASRVVEVLLGLIQPHDLLVGKTIGILGSALIQMVAAVVGVIGGLAIVGSTSVLPDATFSVALASIVFLLLGLVLYSLLFAVAGSTVGRQSEAQNAAMPITLLLLIPYILSLVYVPNNPDAVLSRVLCVLPLTSALVMPTRVAIGAPSIFELFASLVLLAASIAGAAWVGGKVYAGAILTNRRVNLLESLQSVGLLRPRA